MAISVDFPNKLITVPQADCILVSGTLYRLPTDTVFRSQVISLASGEVGIPFDYPIDYNPSYVVFGVTYAPKVEVINGYQVQFTPDTQWSVIMEESNNNVADVGASVLVQNQVQVIPNNSAGLQLVSTGSGLSAAQDTKLTEVHGELRSIEGGEHHSWFMRVLMSAIGGKLVGPDPGVPGTVTGRDKADTKDRITASVNQHGWRTTPPTLDGD